VPPTGLHPEPLVSNLNISEPVSLRFIYTGIFEVDTSPFDKNFDTFPHTCFKFRPCKYLDSITLKYLVNRTNYEAPHHVIFTIPTLHTLKFEIRSAICSQTPSTYVPQSV
jgi:hypothetical protein